MKASVASAILPCTVCAVLLSVVSCRAEAGRVPIRECGLVVNVEPATLGSATGGTGCKTLVLASGTYAKLDIKDRPRGVLTLRCAVPGTCIVGTGSVISSVNGLIVDGIQIRGGPMGLHIKGGSKNVLVRRSTFIEQTAAGVTIGIGTQNDNIQIHGNQFNNAKRGCNTNLPINCSGHLPDGSPVAEMDYGIRVYDTKAVEIKGNQFGTLFNHAISLKYSVMSALIANNTFNSCGRTCLELGQAMPICGDATVTGNLFRGARLVDVHIENIKKAVVTGNSFVGARTAIKVGSGPSGRVIVRAPNGIR